MKELTHSQAEAYFKICNEDLCHKTIGLRATHISIKKACLELPFQPWHMNFEKCCHGGILSLLLDTAMGFCVYPHLIEPECILAIDLKISYLKAATLEMGSIIAESNLVSRTRRLAVSEGEVLSPAGDILCKGLGTYAILKK